MKILLKILLLSLLLGALSSCGTVNGFGQDVSTVGHGISKAAS
jgi:predicted small secreted protein